MMDINNKQSTLSGINQQEIILKERRANNVWNKLRRNKSA